MDRTPRRLASLAFIGVVWVIASVGTLVQGGERNAPPEPVRTLILLAAIVAGSVMTGVVARPFVRRWLDGHPGTSRARLVLAVVSVGVATAGAFWAGMSTLD